MVRQAEGPRPAGWHGARYMPGDSELAKLCFPRLCCQHLPCSSSCVQLCTRPSTAHLLFRVGRSYYRAYKWRLPTSEPGPSPAETGVGQMDPELAGASARHVLGPGQSPCCRRCGVCACPALRGLAVASPAEIKSVFRPALQLSASAGSHYLLGTMGFSFSPSPTEEMSAINARVAEQIPLASFVGARSPRAFSEGYRERAREGVC